MDIKPFAQGLRTVVGKAKRVVGPPPPAAKKPHPIGVRESVEAATNDPSAIASIKKKMEQMDAWSNEKYRIGKGYRKGIAVGSVGAGGAGLAAGRISQKEKRAGIMDQELATAVFSRWGGSLPVDETVFHKAAGVLGLNADDALLEARFYTLLDHDLQKVAAGHRLDEDTLSLYSCAAGHGPAELVKTASSFHIDIQDLVLRKLAERNWVPDLELVKVALMGAGGGNPAAGGMGGAQDAAMPAMPPPDPAQGGMAPMPGAAVQQSPANRYKPSPMAPSQTPPSAQGNMMELVEAARHPDAGSEMGMGGMGPEAGGMGPESGPMGEAQPPVPPDQKIQQVDPSVDPETMARWAPKLEEIEQQTGIQMNDPAQVQKFVAEMQKADSATLDEAIKAMNTPQPFNKPTNPNSPNAKSPADQQKDQQGQQQQGQPAPAQEKVALARAFMP